MSEEKEPEIFIIPKLLPAVAAMLSTIAGLVVVLYRPSSEIGTSKFQVETLEKQLTATQQAMDRSLALQEELQSIKADIRNISKLSSNEKLAFQMSQVQRDIQQITQRQQKLENAILTSPSKALEIPLLQRDIENIKSLQKENIIAIKEGIDRVYDLNKWLLGAMAVSVVTLAVSNFLKGKESSS